MSNIEKFVQPCLLFLGCCSLLLIDYRVQSHAILYIADSAIVFAGVLYYSLFLRNYVYNTYLNSCELGKLIVLYKEMKVKKASVNPWKELGIVSLGIVLGIIILNFVIYNPQGDSISSTYAHYYRTNMKDVCVLREKDLGEKVFAIIYDRKDLAYCIFDKIKIREEDHYIVRNIYKLPWKSNTNRLLDADEYKEMLETENEYAAKAELQTIVVDFYVKNGVVSSDKESCEGYSLNPYISHIEVEEGNLSVEPVQIGEDLLYRWTLWR